MRKRIGIVAVTLLGMLACSDGVSIVGDAMVDAGEALLDAGHELVDASDAMRSDAAAQVRTFEADCEERVVERVTVRATGEVTEGVEYWAEVAVPGLTPETVTHASVVLCDEEVFAVPPRTCDGAHTCEWTPVEPLRCVVAVPQIEAGRAQVRCGWRSTSPSSTWRSARFIIE